MCSGVFFYVYLAGSGFVSDLALRSLSSFDTWYITNEIFLRGCILWRSDTAKYVILNNQLACVCGMN